MATRRLFVKPNSASHSRPCRDEIHVKGNETRKRIKSALHRNGIDVSVFRNQPARHATQHIMPEKSRPDKQQNHQEEPPLSLERGVSAPVEKRPLPAGRVKL
jgi:hypothetical protein